MGAMACAMLACGCGPERSPDGAAAVASDVPGGAQAAPTATRMPFDLGAIVRQVHFAYRPDGNEWAAGHGSYSVRASARQLVVTPRHQLREADSVVTPTLLEGAPLAVELVSMRVGEQDLADGGAALEVLADGSLTISRGGVVERLQNSEAGVEQSWSFAERPGGAGDLRVRLRVRGSGYVGATSSGLHFREPSQGVGLRYGHATWRDARRLETPVPARFADGEILLTVGAEVLRTSAFPAVLDPIISAELGMDEPVSVPAASSQSEPAVTSNGTDSLVVWADLRNDSFEARDVYGARVDGDGNVLDPAGIHLGATRSYQPSPTVGSDGSGYLVVWEESRNETDYVIRGTRVDESGGVLDADGLAIGGAGHSQANPDIAFDGTNYLVVWQDARDGSTNDVYGTRVSPDGVVLDPLGIGIATGPGHQATPAVDYDGASYFVVWTDTVNYDILARQVDRSGELLGADPITICDATGTQRRPEVAFDGERHLVVWQDGRNGVDYDVYAARVTTAGTVLEPTGIPIQTAADDQTSPALAFDGSGYLITWTDAGSGLGDIYGARVNTSGAVLDISGIPICTDLRTQDSSAIAFDGVRFLVAWRDERTRLSGTVDDVYGTRVTTDGVVLDGSGLVLSTQSNQQRGPAVAHDGSGYLVVWADGRDTVSSRTDIYGVRISANGTVLDPSGLQISTASGAQYSPAVAFGGTDYLVAWTDERSAVDRDIYGARVTSQGAVLDPEGLAVSVEPGDQRDPAVASDTASYLVAWADERDPSTAPDVYAGRVSFAGDALDPSGIPLSTASGAQNRAQLAFGSDEYLAVWHDARSLTDYDVYAARVGNAGTTLDEDPLLVAGGPGMQSTPSVAHDGTSFMVAYCDDRGAETGIDVLAKRSAAGRLLDSTPIAISTAAGDQTRPTLAFDGAHFLALWVDTGENPELRATRIRPDGSVVEPEAIGIPAAGEPFGAALAAPTPAQALLVYYRRDEEPPYAQLRVRGRFIEFSELGQPCEGPGDCASGFCVDEVCCDTDWEDSDVGNPDSGPSANGGAGAADQGGPWHDGLSGDEEEEREGDGCGCRVAGAGNASSYAGLAGLLAMVSCLRRRARRRCAAPALASALCFASAGCGTDEPVTNSSTPSDPGALAPDAGSAEGAAGSGSVAGAGGAAGGVAPGADTDGDGLEDVLEARLGTDPLIADTDGDGIDDGAELGDTLPDNPDTDGDGLEDGEELALGSNPTSWDTDGDRLGDGEEAELGTSPTLADTDGDGIDDPVELAGVTDPRLADTDADGWSDSEELDLGTDPVDPLSWDFGGGRWPDFSAAAAAAGAAGGVYAMGEVLPDFNVFDQFGSPVHLYQFYGCVVLIAIADGACPFCQNETLRFEPLWEEHREQGFMVMQVLLNDYARSGSAGLAFRESWATRFGLEFPATGEGDTNRLRDNLLDGGIYTGYLPYFLLLDRELRVRWAHIGVSPDLEGQVAPLL